MTQLPEPNQVILGETREVLRGFPPSSIDTVVTSPPYWNLRDYTKGDIREIGREPTPQDFVHNLLSVFDAIYDVLKPEGSVWVNLADTYRDGSPLMIPEEFCRMMVKTREWKLVNKVIWYKVDAMAESVQHRFSQKWEPFYWFTKGKSYYFEQDAAKIPVKQSSVARLGYKFNQGKSQDVSRMRGVIGDMSSKVDEYLERGVNAGDVWAIPTNKDKVKHAAPYPINLCVRPIVATCPPGGVVFDPFAGSGTTGLATLRVGGDRKFYGTDINPLSVEEANERLKPDKLQGSLF